MGDRLFPAAAAAVVPVDEPSRVAALAYADRLTKPRGSLGRLETIAAQLAAIAGTVPPPIPEPATVAVFAADHGVVAQGVTPWPQEVTAQMVANICAGGAAVNVLARRADVEVMVVDVGVAGNLDALDSPALVRACVRRGTADISVEPAMSAEECEAALDAGVAVAMRAVTAGARCLVTGEMGIGNTTPSAALVAALTGRSARDVTGRGTGVDDAGFERKVAIVERALARSGSPSDPIVALRELGGLEIAALVGFITAAASRRVPVIIDGVIATAALLVAAGATPAVLGYVVSGHRSTEPGATVALEHLGLAPLLDLDMRLGEGTGALLAVPVVRAAAAVLRDMATFDSAGVTDKGEGTPA